jgi:hypothetical protein
MESSWESATESYAADITKEFGETASAFEKSRDAILKLVGHAMHAADS